MPWSFILHTFNKIKKAYPTILAKVKAMNSAEKISLKTNWTLRSNHNWKITSLSCWRSIKYLIYISTESIHIDKNETQETSLEKFLTNLKLKVNNCAGWHMESRLPSMLVVNFPISQMTGWPEMRTNEDEQQEKIRSSNSSLVWPKFSDQCGINFSSVSWVLTTVQWGTNFSLVQP